MSREYPQRPIIGVGAIIEKEGQVVLIKRKYEPDKDAISIPGGQIDVGENVVDAVLREAKEETCLDIEIVKFVDIVDKIIYDKDKKVRFHFVILDYLTKVKGGELKASDDAVEAFWTPIEDLHKYTPFMPETVVELFQKVDFLQKE